MKMPPDIEEDWESKREQIIGLGEHSARKSYYPELQQKLRELEHTKSTLAAANKQLQSVLDAASEVSIIATDHKGIITIFNKGSEKMLGYSAEEIIGKQTPLLFHSALEVSDRGQELSKKLHKQLNGFDAIVEQAKRVGSETREWKYIRKDGTQLLVSLTITVIHSETFEISGFLGIGTNITEQKNLETKLLQSQKMESIGQLAGGLAHDFNNVLTIITGFSSLLQMKLKLKPDQPEADMLGNIITASQRAASLTSSLLTFSRKQVMVKHCYDLNTIISDVGKLLSKLIGEDVHLEISHTDEPLPVLVDSGQIEQVMLNMATNARDAMPQGGTLIIKTSLQNIDEHFVQRHGYCEPGQYAIITISDSGRGMSSETRKKVFEPFFTTKDVGKGTGLGLSMVYGIIQQHNGHINVYSEIGIGTTFQIYLPIVEDNDELDNVNQENRIIPGGDETILVAEDEPTVRLLMENILKESGYAVILAENGQDAIDKFKNNIEQIKLVILDMIMPVKSGKIALEEIQQLQPDVKALFCSGYAPDVIHPQGTLNGDFDFLIKPIKPTDLLFKIRELLDRKINTQL